VWYSLMARVKALSFDMYRTLIDTKDFHEQAVREILARENADSVDPDAFHSRWDKFFDDVWLALGPGEFIREYDVSVESLRRTFREFGINGDPKAGTNIWLSKYESADLFPEVEEVLQILAADYPMVIISNVDDDDLGYAMLKKRNLPFRAIITSESFRSYKPHEKMFKEALSILRCRPGEVLHIGDSQTADVLGAKKAGMLAAWLNRRSHKLKPGIPSPDYEIINLRELLHLDL
jgi:2-haloalkanoic acid dehalogenase type II